MNLSRFNTPVYTGSVSADAAACTGSTLAMTFDGSSYYRGTGVWTSAVDNVGMECWAKTNSSGGYHSLVYNGNDSGGYGIYQAGNTFKGLAQGVAFFGGSDQGNVVEGEWVHLAMVISNGVGSIYVNGVLNGTPFSVAPAAPQGYTSLASAIKPSGGTDGDRFNGDLDEVRIFTFEPGQFSVSDLLIPEPATMSLLGVGMVGLLRRRSR
jgi:hypothetical protein